MREPRLPEIEGGCYSMSEGPWSDTITVTHRALQTVMSIRVTAGTRMKCRRWDLDTPLKPSTPVSLIEHMDRIRAGSWGLMGQMDTGRSCRASVTAPVDRS